MGPSETDDGPIPVFFEKLIMMGLLPFILGGICALFWKILSAIRKKTFKDV